MGSRQKGLAANIAIYLFAFLIASIPYRLFDGIIESGAVFTASATVVVFIFSCILSDVSVYDPYWSVAPPVILVAQMVRFRLWNINSALILFAVGLWAIRLTANWYETYRGIGNEDWRYSMYRRKCSPALFYAISFFGFHLMPTVVVYAGLVSALLAMQQVHFSPLCIPGFCLMISAVILENAADRSIHRFLEEHSGERRTCNISVWMYSRHPNYLGEMSFWTGLYLYFLAACPQKWYCGLGFLSIIALFLLVSIPMMERHNTERRKDYEDYKARTSRVLILPRKR